MAPLRSDAVGQGPGPPEGVTVTHARVPKLPIVVPAGKNKVSVNMTSRESDVPRFSMFTQHSAVSPAFKGLSGLQIFETLRSLYILDLI